MKCMVLNYKREKEQYPPGFGMMTRLQCLNAKLSVLSDSRKQLNYLCPKCWPHNDLYNIMFWPNSHTYRQMTRGSEWYIRDDQYFFGQVPLSYKYGNLSLKSLHFIILGFPELSYERGLCTRYSFCTKVSSCRYAQGLFSHLLQWEVILHLVHLQRLYLHPSPVVFSPYSTYHYLNDIHIFVYRLSPSTPWRARSFYYCNVVFPAPRRCLAYSKYAIHIC